jgi:hypothetical protein
MQAHGTLTGFRPESQPSILFRIRCTVSHVLDVISLPSWFSTQVITSGVLSLVVLVTVNNSRLVAPRIE